MTRVIFLSSSLLYRFLFFCAVPDMLMCNVGPYESMQEDIKMVTHKEPFDTRACEAKMGARNITKMLRHCNN